MAMAVTAGRLLALLPHRVTGIVVACLFLAGSACLWASSLRPGHRAGVDAARQGGAGPVGGRDGSGQRGRQEPETDPDDLDPQDHRDDHAWPGRLHRPGGRERFTVMNHLAWPDVLQA